MINLMRKNQRWLMILISVVVIVAFVFLYNKTDLDKIGQTSVGTIYGKPVEGTEFARMQRQFTVARELGLFELLQLLMSGGRDQGEDYVWNTLILRKQAAKLQIEPSVVAVSNRIKELMPFQTDGQFDLNKYNTFVAEVLTPNGFSETQMNELVSDDLCRAKLHALVGSASIVYEEEVREAYGEAFRKRHVEVVKLRRADFATGITVTPEEITERFTKNKSSYQTDEKRSVTYVVFPLTEEQKKLTGKERIAALQPISDKADTFSQKLAKAGANFAAIASEEKVELKTTTAFSETAVPAELASVPQFGATVFSLSAENPDSDVFQTEDAFYIAHLEKIEPAVPQSMEEATPKITAQLRDQKINDALSKRADEIRTTLQAAIKSGKTFTQAAEAANLKVEKIAPFAPAEVQQNSGPDFLIQMQSASLGEGLVSEFIPSGDGGAIAYLEKLEPLDEAKWNTEKESVMDRFTTGKQEMVFQEWFRAQRAAANIRVGATAG